MSREFDVIVVGAGHAGIEAAFAASRLGCEVLLITTNLERIGYMSCNPSIGGLGKGHMVREMDVFGAAMPFVADQVCIQFRRLNQSKGPAVRGSRIQADKDLYVDRMKSFLSKALRLTIREGEVKKLKIQGNRVCGVILGDGSEINSNAVVVTTGTFLNAVMYVGHESQKGGRVGDISSDHGISDQLRALGVSVKRLKTGTPARVHKDSINWDILERQDSDLIYYPFSIRSPRSYQLPQISCYLSYTDERTHEIIRRNLHLSAMYGGLIEGVGPRYCPSIEDKVVRFADKDRHLTFLEPEGLNTPSIYVQGMSTSLPAPIQLEFLRTIKGLENVQVLRFGYAVEYDFVLPTQIWHSLETKFLENLFLAGQINGTSGYEEAAAQGLMAGINVARKLKGLPPVILQRHEAYIGVLIDDLVTKGTQEPYRMLTSRAEHRLVLREDNVIDRLGNLSIQLGLADDVLKRKIESYQIQKDRLLHQLRSSKIYPTPEVQEKITKRGWAPLKKDVTLEEWLRRPEVHVNDLLEFGLQDEFEWDVAESVEIDVKYDGYIKKQHELIQMMSRLDNLKIPDGIDYSRVPGLSREEVEKLSQIQPRTLGQAQRISGVTPAGIQCLWVYLKLQGENDGRTNRAGVVADSSMV